MINYLSMIIFFFLILSPLFLNANPVFSEDSLNKNIERFILENPEIIIKSLKNFEEKKEKQRENEIKKNLSKNLSKIKNKNRILFDGDEYSKFEVVEFFDYNCGYCKKSHSVIKDLISEKMDVKFIYVNLPILSERSNELAKLSLAIGSKDRNKFIKFHDFLFSKRKPPNDPEIIDFINNLGLNYGKVKEMSKGNDIKKVLQDNLLIAGDLGIRGTPAFIIDNEIISGFVSKKIIKSLLEK